MESAMRVAGLCLSAAILGTGAAHAQQSVDQTTCRSGTMTVLAKEEKTIIWSLDQRGVTQSNGVFNGFTQRCMGVVANVDGKVSGNGWCRNVDPKTGDWTLNDWTASADKPGAGTYSIRYGTGKWKGITGGGTYEGTGQTRPVEEGTYQNCVRVKGTYTVPG